jgi:SAM-dependent methyltransferase
MNQKLKEHWDKVYSVKDLTKLGWYEENPDPCLKLLDECKFRRTDPVIDMGCGAATFIDNLIARGYSNIIAFDISKIALDKIRERLGKTISSGVKFIVGDITDPVSLGIGLEIGLWHDRAMLHFLTEEKERNDYVAVIRRNLRVGGFLIIAAYSDDGAKKCGGLRIHNYNEKALAKLLGDDFKMLKSFRYVYRMPSGGKRPYVYCLFRRFKRE